MCGLVGVIGQVGNTSEKVFRDLLYMDVVRGPHSTGVVNITPQGTPLSAKGAMDPYRLAQTKRWKDIMGKQSVGLMGHNRYATVGDVNAKNAHPFQHHGVVGMHNGTLRNWRGLLKDASGFTVDSECLIHNIGKYGAVETLEKTDGAFALTWYDINDHTFNMIRNHERPLWVWRTKHGATLFYASEPWMLEAATARHNVFMDPVGPEQLPTQKLVTFDLPLKEFGQLIKKPATRDVKVYQRPIFKRDFSRASGNNGSGGSDEWSKLQAERKHINDDYIAWQGDELEFILTEILEPHFIGQSWYMEGEMAYWPNHPVRVKILESEAEEFMELSGQVLEGVVEGLMAPYVGGGSTRDVDGLYLDPGYLLVNKMTVAVAPPLPPQITKQKKADVIHLPTTSKQIDVNGQPLTELEFDALTDKGCASCQCNLFYNGKAVTWLDQGQVICHECNEELQVEANSSTKN